MFLHDLVIHKRILQAVFMFVYFILKTQNTLMVVSFHAFSRNQSTSTQKQSVKRFRNGKNQIDQQMFAYCAVSL